MKDSLLPGSNATPHDIKWARIRARVSGVAMIAMSLALGLVIVLFLRKWASEPYSPVELAWVLAPYAYAIGVGLWAIGRTASATQTDGVEWGPVFLFLGGFWVALFSFLHCALGTFDHGIGVRGVAVLAIPASASVALGHWRIRNAFAGVR